MATYTELHDLAGNSILTDKISVAVAIKAHEIAISSSTVEEITWAKEALVSPRSKAIQIIHYVLAANSNRTVEQINSAPDSGANSIQEAVDSAVDNLLSK